MADKKTVLTLNLGSQRVGAARFGIAGKGALTLREYAFVSMPGDPSAEGNRRSSIEPAVSTLVKHLKATDSEVNFAIPGNSLIAKFVKLPPIAEDKVDEIVTFEAKGAVPFPLEEAAWDYQIMGTKVGEVEAAIVAARGDQVEELTSAVRAAGLQPDAVDGAPIALYNAFRYNYPDVTEPSLIIDLGARTTNLVFVDGVKAFISSAQIGGAAITQAISKEMGADFETAEERKTAEGFVHLGGNYADHEDPEVDAMSKIIRNTVIRIDGDIRRRITNHKQQGGNSPVRAFICGAGASLPYLKEVLEEKLGMPVEFFNPLRNVTIGPKVDTAALQSETHLLGELVGLALREMACPMELDLAPKSVQATRDLDARKPYLMTAAAALLASLGGCWLSNSGAVAKYAEKGAAVDKELAILQGFDSKIKAKDTELETLTKKSELLGNVVRDRYFWTQLLNELNSHLKDDKIWFTQIALVNSVVGKEPSPQLFPGVDSRNPFSASGSARALDPAKANQYDSILIAGVNRHVENDTPDIAKVNALFTAIIQSPGSAQFFKLVEKAEDLKNEKKLEELRVKHVINNPANGGATDGYPFHLLIPLARPVTVNPSAAAPAAR